MLCLILLDSWNMLGWSIRLGDEAAFGIGASSREASIGRGTYTQAQTEISHR